MESSFEYQFDPYIIVFNCEGINCYTFLPNYFLWGKKKTQKATFFQSYGKQAYDFHCAWLNVSMTTTFPAFPASVVRSVDSSRLSQSYHCSQ